jgi:hypothetical protein
MEEQRRSEHRGIRGHGGSREKRREIKKGWPQVAQMHTDGNEGGMKRIVGIKRG